jgi:hypothetical protein
MGKLHASHGWLIKVQGDEHPPVHVHVIHPDGKATVALDGSFVNSGVPANVLTQARQWVAEHGAAIQAEWARMNNPRVR